jgi:hypothetical protein
LVDNDLNYFKNNAQEWRIWLNQAKRAETRWLRIAEIIRLCEQNIKSRP